MPERRKLERFNLQVPAKIGVMSQDQEKEIFDILTSDLCAGGAFFHMDRPLPVGTQMKIDLILPIEKLQKLKGECLQAHVKITGTVLRSVKTGMAVCFNADYEIRPCREGEPG